MKPWKEVFIAELRASATLAGRFAFASLSVNSLRFLSVGLSLNEIAPLIWTFSPVALTFSVAMPLVVGGILLMQGNDTGLYRVATSVLAGFFWTLQNGWVLMVEILR
jgi:hypothetical protein